MCINRYNTFQYLKNAAKIDFLFESSKRKILIRMNMR